MCALTKKPVSISTKVQSSHHHKFDHLSSQVSTRVIWIIKCTHLAYDPHDKGELIAIWNRNTDSVVISFDANPVHGVFLHQVEGSTIHYSAALIHVHANVDTLVEVIHGPHTDLVDDVQALTQGNILGINSSTLVRDQIKPLIRLSMDLIAEGDLGQVEGAELFLRH